MEHPYSTPKNRFLEGTVLDDRDIQVILIPTADLARKYAGKFEASVEAEYGSYVLEGTEVTLAHHVEQYRHNPAPCNTANVTALRPGAKIVVSHIDLDALGGVLALLSGKPHAPEFWRWAEFLDLNGGHRMHEVPAPLHAKFHAYYAWEEGQEFARPSADETMDVTAQVLQHAQVLDRILNGDATLLAAGLKWATEQTEMRARCLSAESDKLRLFVVPDGEWCADAYYSERQGKTIPVTITHDLQNGSLTIACCDGSINCRDIVQSLFGPEAGGHDGIAGSPRGQRMTDHDRNTLVRAVDPGLGPDRDIHAQVMFLRKLELQYDAALTQHAAPLKRLWDSLSERLSPTYRAKSFEDAFEQARVSGGVVVVTGRSMQNPKLIVRFRIERKLENAYKVYYLYVDQSTVSGQPVLPVLAKYKRAGKYTLPEIQTYLNHHFHYDVCGK